MVARGSGRARTRSSAALRRPASSRGLAKQTRSLPLSPELVTDIVEVARPFGLGVANAMALAAVMAQSWPRYLGALRRLAAFCFLRGLLVISLESADFAMAEL
eukprot:930850-Pyramimonas_sp.AAC.1